MYSPLLITGRWSRNWRTIRMINHGHLGIVFKVRQRHSLRTGALKVCRPNATEAEIRQFRDETAFMVGDDLAGFKPKCYEALITDTEVYYVMARVGRLPKKLSARRLVRVICRIARALEKLHSLKRIHCDVKPENIGIVNGEAVLCDYDSMQTFDNARLNPRFVGTWGYMAPEVQRRQFIDYRADIYSLGQVLKALCRDRDRHIFSRVIDKATAEAIQDRYQSMAEFITALKSCRQDYLRTAMVTTRFARFSKIIKWIGIAALGLIAATATVFSLYGKFKSDVQTHRESVILNKQLQMITPNVYLDAAQDELASGEITNAIKRIKMALQNGCRDTKRAKRLLEECTRALHRQGHASRVTP